MHRDGRPGIHCRSIVEDPREEAGFENGPDGGIEPVAGAGPEVGTDEVETESEARLVAGPRSVPELEANAFAAALIMPRHLMREQYERHEGDCEAMRNEFGASQKAMRYRIDAMKTWG
jgi:hypothetical protein